MTLVFYSWKGSFQPWNQIAMPLNELLRMIWLERECAGRDRIPKNPPRESWDQSSAHIESYNHYIHDPQRKLNSLRFKVYYWDKKMTFLVLLRCANLEQVMAGAPPTECCIFRHSSVDDQKNFWAPYNYWTLEMQKRQCVYGRNICTCLAYSDKKSSIFNQFPL